MTSAKKIAPKAMVSEPVPSILPVPVDIAEAKIKKTKIDTRRAAQSKDQRRTPPPPGWGSSLSSPYIEGPIDLSYDIPLEEAENQGIRIPLDPRIFTAATLKVVQSGKFDRRHARNISGFLAGCTRFLDLGAGFGYVALRAKTTREDLHIAVQDDRAALIQFGTAIAAKHFPVHAAMITYSAQPLRSKDAPTASYTGLDNLLVAFKPDVLRLPGTLLPAKTLTKTRLKDVRRILFPFLDVAELERDRATYSAYLKPFGFTEDTGGEANGTLFLRRE